MDIPSLLTHFSTHAEPLFLSRSGALTWDDADLHRSAHGRDPEGYALLSLAPGVQPWQRARVLLQTLATSQAGVDEASRVVLARVVRALLFGLPPVHVITVLLALRHLRANHKHTTRAMLAFVLEHPEAEALIEARRPALADCFEHALGKTTARGCARRIAEGDTGSDYLRTRLLRFTTDPSLAIDRVKALYAPGTPDAIAPQEPPLPLDPPRQHAPTATATNRGDIAATLVHLLRSGNATLDEEPSDKPPRTSPSEDREASDGGAVGGADRELRGALFGYVRDAVSGLPRFRGSLALVFDTSASMRGYGEREWAVLSQAVALRLVLSEVCERLTVVETGGRQDAPEGATDLATGLLDALETGPDLVAIVTDGYENVLPGDLARVVATLPHAGITTPVVLCQAAFTGGDDLTLRDPAPDLPHRPFWHQDDFSGLMAWLFAHCEPGTTWVRSAMRTRLDMLAEGVKT